MNAPVKKCGDCGFLNHARRLKCERCGHEFEPAKSRPVAANRRLNDGPETELDCAACDLAYTASRLHENKLTSEEAALSRTQLLKSFKILRALELVLQ